MVTCGQSTCGRTSQAPARCGVGVGIWPSSATLRRACARGLAAPCAAAGHGGVDGQGGRRPRLGRQADWYLRPQRQVAEGGAGGGGGRQGACMCVCGMRWVPALERLGSSSWGGLDWPGRQASGREGRGISCRGCWARQPAGIGCGHKQIIHSPTCGWVLQGPATVSGPGPCRPTHARHAHTRSLLACLYCLSGIRPSGEARVRVRAATLQLVPAGTWRRPA